MGIWGRTFDIRLYSLWMAAVVAGLIGFAGIGSAAEATDHNIVVDSVIDSNDIAPGDGYCLDENGACSLRAAIQEANALPGKQAILLGSDTYVMSLSNSGGGSDDTAERGDLDILDDVDIVGVSQSDTIVDGGTSIDRVFQVHSGVNATFMNMTIANGSTTGYSLAGYGGGLWNGGNVTITNVTFKNNATQAGGNVANLYGGRMSIVDSLLEGNANGGLAQQTDGSGQSPSLTVRGSVIRSTTGSAAEIMAGRASFYDTEFTDNAANAGGALYVTGSGAQVLLERVDIHTNRAAYGGGVYSYGDLTILDSDIRGNVADSVGGGVVVSGNSSLAMENARIASNEAGTNGGGVFYDSYAKTVTIRDSAITDNTAAGKGGGVYVAESQSSSYFSLMLEGNRLEGNSAENGANVYNAYSRPVSAKRNYWGDALGAGSNVYGSVSSVPWYADASMTELTGPANLLQSLVVDGPLEPQFDSERFQYALLARTAPSVTLAASSYGGTVKINGEAVADGADHTVPLAIGKNAIRIVVEDGASPREYLIEAYRTPYIVLDSGIQYPQKQWNFDFVTKITPTSTHIYAADSGNHRIVKMLPADGTIVGEYREFTAGTEQHALYEPDEAVLDSLGNLYISDSGNHRIVVLDPDGQFLRFIADGALSYPNGIALDSDGNVYVADAGNDRIVSFSDTGEYRGEWSPGATEDVTDVVVTAEGKVYVSYSVTAMFMGYDGFIQQVSAASLEAVGDPISIPKGGFGEGAAYARPNTLAVNADGDLLVLDEGQDAIYAFGTTDNGLLGSITFPDEIDSPIGFGVGPTGLVYVSNYNSDSIFTMNDAGAAIAEWASSGAAPGLFDYPNDVRFDGNGYMYVVDRWNSRVQKFAKDGAVQAIYVDDDQPFDDVDDVAVDPNDNVYVIDYGSRRLVKFDASGTKIKSITLSVPPTGIVRHPNGNLFVSTESSTVYEFSVELDNVGAWGASEGPERIENPTDIDADSEGRLYLLQPGTSEVKVFDRFGGFIRSFGAPEAGTGLGYGTFDYARSLAVDPSGYIFVSDNERNWISVFTQTGDFTGYIDVSGGGALEEYSLAGIAFDPFGDLYVTDSYKDRIIKMNVIRTDSRLRSIDSDIGHLTAPFEPSASFHEIRVPHGTSAVNVTLSVYEPSSTMTVNGVAWNRSVPYPLALASGLGQMDVLVTAEDGNVTHYAVVARYLANDAALMDIALTDGLPPVAVDEGTYRLELSETIASTVPLTATLPAHAAATVTGATYAVDGDRLSVAIEPTTTSFVVTVTAQDESRKDYRFVVKRLSSVAALTSLRLGADDVTAAMLAAADRTLTYTVPLEVGSLTVTSQVYGGSESQLFIDGVLTTDGAAVAYPMPNAGFYTVLIKVVSPDRLHETEYRLLLERQAPTGSAAPVARTAYVDNSGHTIVVSYDRLLNTSASLNANLYAVTGTNASIAWINYGTDGRSIEIHLTPSTGVTWDDVTTLTVSAGAAFGADGTRSVAGPPIRVMTPARKQAVLQAMDPEATGIEVSKIFAFSRTPGVDINGDGVTDQHDIRYLLNLITPFSLD